MSSTYQIYHGVEYLLGGYWRQGDWRDKNGKVCAVQAVLDILGLEGERLPDLIAREILQEIFRKDPGFRRQLPLRFKLFPKRYRTRCIIRWNDAKGRKESEVVSLFRALAGKHKQEWLAQQICQAEGTTPPRAQAFIS